MSKIGSHKTTVTKENEILKVIYHSTVVYRENLRSGEITLNSGGYRTKTTKKRINQAFQEFERPFYIFQKDFKWFVRLKEKQETIEFLDYMIII